VLNGTKLADLQTLFADEMQISNSPLGSPTEISPLMIPVLPVSQTWDEWLKQHSIGGMKPYQARTNKHRIMNQPGQLPIRGSSQDE
jgi:hypothetical protein